MPINGFGSEIKRSDFVETGTKFGYKKMTPEERVSECVDEICKEFGFDHGIEYLLKAIYEKLWNKNNSSRKKDKWF